MIDPRILDELNKITAEERDILEGSDSIDRDLYMVGNANTITSHKLLDRDKLITVRQHPRFIHFPEHTHDFVELVYVCQGATTHIVNGEKLTVRAGELLLMGQNTRQEIDEAGPGDLAVNLIIRPAFFETALPYLGEDETPLRRFIVDCLTGGRESNFLYFRVADVPQIQHLMENLLWTLISQAQNRRELNQIMVTLLFALLLNHTDRLFCSSPEQELTFQVLRYIENHYKDGSLTEIAAQLHYTPARLSREIHRKTGKTYTELVQNKRMAQAAWLLKNTGRTVADVALTVGYENIGYFHRLFAGHFGLSPKKYRDCK